MATPTLHDKNGTELRQSGSCHHTRSMPQPVPCHSLTGVDGLAFCLIDADGKRT